MTVYFGRHWNAPAFDGAQKVPTPVGDICFLCDQEIQDGDDGTTYANGGAVHLECWLRMGLGSPAHLQGMCSCSGQEEPEDDRTWREQGREVIRLIGRGDWVDGHHSQ